jgi:2-oxoisovalerate dehydrogenase E1 component beta subunit
VLILGEDVGKNGGVFRVTEGLWQEFGDERVIDTPLSEAGIIGTSLGLGINGFKPIVEIQFMGFIYPGFEQIVCHVARFRTRTQGVFSAPLVIRAPYGGGIHAPELHSDSTESLFVHIPGLKVVTPATPTDAKGLLLSAIRDPDPVLFLEPMKLYRSIKEEVTDAWYEIPIGKAKIVHQGEDVTLLAWGGMVPVAMETAKHWEGKGVTCDVIDLRSLYPLDESVILDSAKRTGRVVIVHEAPRTAGLGAEVAALIQEKAFLYLEAPILRVTGYDVPVPMYALEASFRPDVKRVSEAIQQVISY